MVQDAKILEWSRMQKFWNCLECRNSGMVRSVEILEWFRSWIFWNGQELWNGPECKKRGIINFPCAFGNRRIQIIFQTSRVFRNIMQNKCLQKHIANLMLCLKHHNYEVDQRDLVLQALKSNNPTKTQFLDSVGKTYK